MSVCCHFTVLLLCFFLSGSPELHTYEQPRNPVLKAERIESFARYIQWPEETAAPGPFIIKIWNDEYFAEHAKYLFAGRKIKNRQVEISHITNVDEIFPCNILYLGNVKEEHLAALLKVLDRKPILTIGDSVGLANKGLIINFLNEGEKFEINYPASQKANLVVSSRLLEVAKVIH